MKWSQVRNLKLILVALISFMAAVILMQTTLGSWRGKPAAVIFAEHVKLAGSLASSVANILQSPFKDDPGIATTLTPAQNLSEDFEQSRAFHDMVMGKNETHANVTEYLTSIGAYLLHFRSPMIREDPGQYSWQETRAERKQRLARVQSIKSLTEKKIVWYNVPGYMQRKPSKETFRYCPVKECVLKWTYEPGADAVLINQCPGPKLGIGNHSGHINVFYAMESPVLTRMGRGLTPWGTAFNWTWNYRIDSDIFEPVGYLKRSDSVPSHSRLLQITRQKDKHVSWFTSNCNVQSKRDQYVKRLRQVIPADIYGKCGQLVCRNKGIDCLKLLNQYYFYLSFENAMCHDYVTEKYYKTFNEDVHVVPVVRGGANYSRYFPEGTFIDAESFSSPEELGQYLLNLTKDEARYVDMLWRKAHFLYHEHGIVDAYCRLCYKVHYADRFLKTYSDLRSWYNKDKCWPPGRF